MPKINRLNVTTKPTSNANNSQPRESEGYRILYPEDEIHLMQHNLQKETGTRLRETPA